MIKLNDKEDILKKIGHFCLSVSMNMAIAKGFLVVGVNKNLIYPIAHHTHINLFVVGFKTVRNVIKRGVSNDPTSC